MLEAQAPVRAWATKVVQAAPATAKRGLWEPSFESRTWMVWGQGATSTQVASSKSLRPPLCAEQMSVIVKQVAHLGNFLEIPEPLKYDTSPRRSAVARHVHRSGDNTSGFLGCLLRLVGVGKGHSKP
jgi:hypothetical protein